MWEVFILDSPKYRCKWWLKQITAGQFCRNALPFTVLRKKNYLLSTVFAPPILLQQQHFWGQEVVIMVVFSYCFCVFFFFYSPWFLFHRNRRLWPYSQLFCMNAWPKRTQRCCPPTSLLIKLVLLMHHLQTNSSSILHSLAVFATKDKTIVSV